MKTADVLVGPAFTQEMADAARACGSCRSPEPAPTGSTSSAAGVPVANTYHHEDSIAEYIVWASIALRRELPQADAALRQNRWRSPVYDAALPQTPDAVEREGRLRRLRPHRPSHLAGPAAFGAQAHAVTAVEQADGLSWAGDTTQLPRLLDESDVVVVSAPLTETTRGIIGADELSELGADGVLVNVARGPLVQETGAVRRSAQPHDPSAPPSTSGTRTRPAATRPNRPSALRRAGQRPAHTAPVRDHPADVPSAASHDIAANITALAEGSELRNSSQP